MKREQANVLLIKDAIEEAVEIIDGSKVMFNFNSNKITLKEYMEDKFRAVEKSKDIALASMDKRLDSMNEIKGAMKDQQGTFITRSEFETKLELLVNKIEMIQKLLYIGVGAVLVLQIVFKVLIK